MNSHRFFNSKMFNALLVFVLFFCLNTLFSQEIVPPQCYSGNRLLKEFIKEEMVYPSKALADNIEGKVELSFIVKPDGSTTDMKVTKPVSPDIDAEAKRICKKILWYPATELGKPIAYMQTMEFKFDCKKYLSLCKARGYDSILYPHLPVDTSSKVYSEESLDTYPKPVFTTIDRNFSNFIHNHLQYPDAAFKQNIAGTVKLRFVVEPSGRISNIVTEKSVGGGCTEEAIQVVRELKWMPGTIKNLAVRSFMNLEITFDIASHSVGGAIPTPGTGALNGSRFKVQSFRFQVQVNQRPATRDQQPETATSNPNFIYLPDY